MASPNVTKIVAISVVAGVSVLLLGLLGYFAFFSNSAELFTFKGQTAEMMKPAGAHSYTSSSSSSDTTSRSSSTSDDSTSSYRHGRRHSHYPFGPMPGYPPSSFGQYGQYPLSPLGQYGQYPLSPLGQYGQTHSSYINQLSQAIASTPEFANYPLINACSYNELVSQGVFQAGRPRVTYVTISSSSRVSTRKISKILSPEHFMAYTSVSRAVAAHPLFEKAHCAYQLNPLQPNVLITEDYGVAANNQQFPYSALATAHMKIYALDLINAVKALHVRGFVHRNIKLSNIFRGNQNAPDANNLTDEKAVLGDFKYAIPIVSDTNGTLRSNDWMNLGGVIRQMNNSIIAARGQQQQAPAVDAEFEALITMLSSAQSCASIESDAGFAQLIGLPYFNNVRDSPTA